MLQKVGQIAINAKDVERATAFYRDVLEMRFLFAAPPKMAFFDVGGTWLLIGEASAPEFDHPSSILYFDVADVAATWQVLKDRGVRFREDPHVLHRQEGKELWMASFWDTEGNTLAVRCWK
jgi:methylmalonyl-CoA/ethylmalonyl-CoA epimerase